jgi:peptide/nickel transport system permease protein
VARLILNRLLQAIVALLMLSILVFVMSRATGDPVTLLLPESATAADREQLRVTLGLDKPVAVQYAIFMTAALHGDFGRSVQSGVSVSTLLVQGLQNSAALAIPAFALTFVLGIPLGMLSALLRATAVDGAVRVVSILGISLPGFFVGILLIQVFAVWLQWLPAGTYQGPAHIVLPAIALALGSMAGVARLLRSSALEVLDSEFVKLARAKGLNEQLVIWKHVLKNSLLPVASVAGILFVGLLTSAITVETVFAWPGIGTLTFRAIIGRDFPVIQAVALLAAGLAIAINALTDIFYTYLDPRIRYGHR